MEKKLLKVGDVFSVKAGWNVQTSIPEKFVYANSHSSKLIDSVITVNHSYSNNKNDFIDDLVKDIIEVFDNKGITMRYETALNFVYQNTEEIRSEDSKNEKFILNPGIFVVVEAKLTGGGTGHGKHDIYPDGWEITAKRLKEDGSYDSDSEEIKFFQSGSFAHLVNVNIPVLRTMKKETKFV